MKIETEEYFRVIGNLQTAVNKANERILELEKINHKCVNCKYLRIKDFVYGYCDLDNMCVASDYGCEGWEVK